MLQSIPNFLIVTNLPVAFHWDLHRTNISTLWPWLPSGATDGRRLGGQRNAPSMATHLTGCTLWICLIWTPGQWPAVQFLILRAFDCLLLATLCNSVPAPLFCAGLNLRLCIELITIKIHKPIPR